jgi:hypothetical protein
MGRGGGSDAAGGSSSPALVLFTPPSPNPAATQLVDAAAEGDAQAVLALLVDGAVDVDARGAAGTTALMEASAGGWTSVVLLLLGRGASLQATDVINWSALHYASFNGRFRVVEELLGAGADVAARSVDDETATDLALQAAVEPGRLAERGAVTMLLMGAGELPAVARQAAEAVLMQQLLLPAPTEAAAVAAAAQELAELELESLELEAALELAELEAELEVELRRGEEQEQEQEQESEDQESEEEEQARGRGESREAVVAPVLVPVPHNGTELALCYSTTPPLPPAAAAKGEAGAQQLCRWAEPQLLGFYRTRGEQCCRTDGELIAAVSAMEPARQLASVLIPPENSVTAEGVRAFAARARERQRHGALGSLAVAVAGCTLGGAEEAALQLGALAGVAVHSLDISGARGLRASDVREFAASVQQLQARGCVSCRFRLVARGCDWTEQQDEDTAGAQAGNDEGSLLLPWVGVRFGFLDVSKFTGLTPSALASFARYLAADAAAAGGGVAPPVEQEGVQVVACRARWSEALLAAMAVAGPAMASLDLSWARSVGGAAGLQAWAGGAALRRCFRLRLRHHAWEAGELRALGGERSRLRLSLLDISGATGIRRAELATLANHLSEQQRAGSMGSLTLLMTEVDWSGALLSALGAISFCGGRLDISGGHDIALADLSALGAAIRGDQQRRGGGTRARLSLIAEDCSRVASGVDWVAVPTVGNVEAMIGKLLGAAGLAQWGDLIIKHIRPQTVAELREICITDLRRLARLAGFADPGPAMHAPAGGVPAFKPCKTQQLVAHTEPTDEQYAEMLALLGEAASSVDADVDVAWLRSALAGVQLAHEDPAGIDRNQITLQRQNPELLLLGEELGLAAKLGVIPHDMKFHNIVA